VIAGAGVHLLLGWDPATDAVSVLAGTTVEGLRDGPAADGWLAQPSGLAVDGDRVWFADSETSALRYLTAPGKVTGTGELRTVVGEGLFDFGHVDGPAGTARLQHPLGVTLLTDGSIAIADTYNGAIRRYDPATGEVGTLATGLVLVGDDIVVIESAAHRLTRPVTAGQLRQVLGAQLQTERPATELAAGTVELSVPFRPPAGRKLDDRYGPATRLVVSSSPPSLLTAGAGDGAELHRTLVLRALPGESGTDGVLHITAQAASCDDDQSIEHPACYLARQDWGVPIRVVGSSGDTELELPLLG
jgi:hypothetical protein